MLSRHLTPATCHPSPHQSRTVRRLSCRDACLVPVVPASLSFYLAMKETIFLGIFCSLWTILSHTTRNANAARTRRRHPGLHCMSYRDGYQYRTGQDETGQSGGRTISYVFSVQYSMSIWGFFLKTWWWIWWLIMMFFFVVFFTICYLCAFLCLFFVCSFFFLIFWILSDWAAFFYDTSWLFLTLANLL